MDNQLPPGSGVTLGCWTLVTDHPSQVNKAPTELHTSGIEVTGILKPGQSMKSLHHDETFQHEISCWAGGRNDIPFLDVFWDWDHSQKTYFSKKQIWAEETFTSLFSTSVYTMDLPFNSKIKPCPLSTYVPHPEQELTASHGTMVNQEFQLKDCMAISAGQIYKWLLVVSAGRLPSCHSCMHLKLQNAGFLALCWVLTCHVWFLFFWDG